MRCWRKRGSMLGLQAYDANNKCTLKGVPTSFSFFMMLTEASKLRTTPVALIRQPACPVPVFWIASTPAQAKRHYIAPQTKLSSCTRGRLMIDAPDPMPVIHSMMLTVA